MKTKIYLVLSTVTALLLASCSGNSGDKAGNEASTEAQPLLHQTSPQTYKHVIPLDAIQDMVNTYETDRVSKLRSINGQSFTDSKNGWVSLEDLEGFVEEVKAATKNKGLESKDVGVRFYFSVYPQQHEGESAYFKSLESDYRSKQTFLLLPTYYDAKTNTHYDVLSTTSNRSQELFVAGGTAKESKNIDDEGGAKSRAAIAPPQQSCIALNHMALCPPACPN